MLEKKTVLVLGAGSSVEFKLPVGTDLAQMIANRTAFWFDGGAQTGGDRELYEACALIPEIRPRLFEIGRLIATGLPLARSIDDFLYNHDEEEAVVAVGKTGIVQSILHAERNSHIAAISSTTGSMSEAGLAAVSNSWLVGLFRYLQIGVKRSDISKVFNNLSIINFNYDRCVEQLFPILLQRAYGASAEEARRATAETLDISHPYGQVGALPWQVDRGIPVEFGAHVLGSPLTDLGVGIRTFTEQAQEPQELEHWRGLLGLADQIVFLGFGFHRQNVSLLQREMPSAATVFATSYGASAYDAEVFHERVSTMLQNRAAPRHFMSSTCVDLINTRGLAIAG